MRIPTVSTNGTMCLFVLVNCVFGAFVGASLLHDQPKRVYEESVNELGRRMKMQSGMVAQIGLKRSNPAQTSDPIECK
ncbi:unnamed protein product [Protopolystoma xenopodis]|uniref:Uncharacterized protein n=1 Tax=Protopolystoma xenopodis TaxID=117903 RepID=A0A3S5BVF4_9PLAT|nr:unnamed protein product [Protopolystoma xenopodis]